MSEIAKALANAVKITESGNVQRAHQMSAEAIRKNHIREFIWGGLVFCVCLITLGAFLANSTNTISPPPAALQPPTSAEVLPPPEPVAPKWPSPELETELANLIIKAFIKSSNPRVLIGDRVIQLGDELIPGLILSGVDAHGLIATDAQGVTYRKKM